MTTDRVKVTETGKPIKDQQTLLTKSLLLRYRNGVKDTKHKIETNFFKQWVSGKLKWMTADQTKVIETAMQARTK